MKSPILKNPAPTQTEPSSTSSPDLSHARREPHPLNPRLQVITVDPETIKAFFEATGSVDSQQLTYVPYTRLLLGDTLREVGGDDLKETLNAILHNRTQGGFTIDLPPGHTQEEFIKWGTAISYLLGQANHDAMSGNFYAIFQVKDTDESDSYLRQAYRRFTLHTDGTFVNEPTDWLLMMKMEEAHAVGGFSRLLHLDDWERLEEFSRHPLAHKEILYKAPPSKNQEQTVRRPTFFDVEGKPGLCFIDQFAHPADVAEARYLSDLSRAMEESPAVVELELPVGGLVVLNNLFWAHGREAFQKNPKLNRTLMRQRGSFAPEN